MDWQFIKESLPQVIGAIPITFEMAFAAVIIGWIFGLLMAFLCRLTD